MAQQTTTVGVPKVQIAGQFAHGEVNKDGLAAFLMPHKSQFKIGDPILLSFGLIFVGPGLDAKDPPTLSIKVRRPFVPSDPHNYSWLEVRRADGQLLPYTGDDVEYGPPKPSADNCTLLYRGDLVGKTANLGIYYRVENTGTYKVRWTFKVDDPYRIWSGELVSNEVEIDVVK